MKISLNKASLFSALLTISAATPALADHNSPWGEGWASMPNDVHNTRLDEDVSDEEFIDFVSGGGGADSVNRFLDDEDTTTVGMGGSMSGSAPDTVGGMGGGGAQRGR